MRFRRAAVNALEAHGAGHRAGRAGNKRPRQHPSLINWPRHVDAPRRLGGKPERREIRFVTDQNNQGMAGFGGCVAGSLDQSCAQAKAAIGRLNRERSKHQDGGVVDGYGPDPGATDQAPIDQRDHRQIEDWRVALAQALRRLGEPARPEGARDQGLDQRGVGGTFVAKEGLGGHERGRVEGGRPVVNA